VGKSTKQEMLRLKELTNSLKSALSKSQERIDSLKTEREQLLMKLEEINSLIQLKEANSTQLPKMAEERKKEMTAKYNELMTIQSKKDKALSGSTDEDNRLIAEADAVRFECSSYSSEIIIPNSFVTCDVPIIDT
jgi:chromosome segregation ATPase